MDLVNLMDKKYSGKNAVPCPREGQEGKVGTLTTSYHGNLAVHGSGAYLVCGVCGASVPTSNVVAK